jgi:HEAT repeat protein
MDRQATLPETVYRDVLPRHAPAFAVLDRLHDRMPGDRRQAAQELLALSGKQPLGRLAVARLCQLTTAETDPVVWLAVLEAVRNDGGEPAVRMARTALGQPAGEVRRRACEHLAAHPDPAHEVFLLPLLADTEQTVVTAAIRALGAAGRVADADALRRQCSSRNEEVQLEAAAALLRIGDPGGGEALERLSYSGDFKTRAGVARALGTLGDRRYAHVLIRLLDDPRTTVSRAALDALPQVAGPDAAGSADGSHTGAAEQVARWKAWYAARK